MNPAGYWRISLTQFVMKAMIFVDPFEFGDEFKLVMADDYLNINYTMCTTYKKIIKIMCEKS